MKFHLKCSLDWLRGIINKHLEFLHHRKATISTANWKLDSGALLNAQAAGLARFAASPLIHWQDGGQAVCSQGRLLKEGIQWKWADGHSSGTVTDTTHRRHPCPLGRHPKCTPVTGENSCLDGGPRPEPEEGIQLVHRRLVLHWLFTRCYRVQNDLSMTHLESNNFYFQR